MKFKKIISALAAVSMLSSVFAANALAAITKDSPVVMKVSYAEKDISKDKTYKKYAATYNAYDVTIDLVNAPTNYTLNEGGVGTGTAITGLSLVLSTGEGIESGEKKDWWLDGGQFVADTKSGSYVQMTSGSPLYDYDAVTGDANDGVDYPVLLVKKTVSYVKLIPTAASVTTMEYTNGEQVGGTAADYDLVNGLLKIDDTTAAGFEIGTKPADPKLSKVEITATATEVVDGQTLALTAKAVNDDNSENKTATLAWDSSDKEVATVEGGVVTAKKPGTTTISVTATDGTDTATATVDITVTKAPAILNSLNVTGADTVVEGETITLGYDAKDQYGDEFTATKTEWTSSKEEIATVDENGVVTGVAAGTARITLKVNGSIEAFKDVTVTAKPVVNPVITINGQTGFVDGVAVTAGEEKGFVWTPVVISNYNSKAGTYTATFKAEGTPDKTAVLKGLPAIEGNPTVTFAVILRTNKTGVKLGIDFAE